MININEVGGAQIYEYVSILCQYSTIVGVNLGYGYNRINDSQCDVKIKER